MKQIVVKISGECEVYTFVTPLVDLNWEKVSKYAWIPDMVDDKLVDDMFYEFPFIISLDELTWYDEDGVEHYIEKKGKYINRKDYLSKALPTLPFVYQLSDNTYYEFEYIIELKDDEEFDPMKLQLMKSDYEVDFLPYGIITTGIMYDGREITYEDYADFDLMSNQCYLYKNSIPYA